MSDDELARAIRDGDRSAEAALATRMFPRIRAWARHRMRDTASADDVAQEVVIIVLETLRKNRVEQLDEGRFGAFIAGTCRNVLLARRRGERRREGLLDKFGGVFAGVSTIDDGAVDRHRVAHCFEKLTARAQSILALTFFADASGDDIARELDVSTANVRVLRHRAIQQLQECVGS